jgi:murein L,D-transpeptidase YcbB/YkuD
MKCAWVRAQMRRGSLVVAGLACLTASAAGAADPEVAVIVDSVIGSAYDPELRWPDISDVETTLQDLYGAEPDRLFWFADTVPDPSVPAVVKGLALADEQGLDRANYDADWLMKRWTEIRSGARSAPAQRALFDLALTVNVARLLSAVHRGRVDPATLEWGYDMTPRTLDLPRILRDLRVVGDPAHAIPALEPPFPHYARARQMLARYQAAAAAGEPPLVSDLPQDRKKIDPGQAWAGVGQMAARLRTFGDLPAGDPAPAAGAPYDGPLVAAVKRFQRRHGLEPDGVIGAGTIEAVNVPLARRVRQIGLAMERMRWLPEMHYRPIVFVNVALFRLWATDPVTGSEPLRMRVVVGQSLEHQTPLFVDRMEYVVFRPYWNPPPGITAKELVPHIQRDRAYFERENLEIVAGGGDDATTILPLTPENLSKVASGKLYLRQKPGPRNSLGLAKFIFPNASNVYMHGTPAQSLFSRARRDFSHGCIRLESPARLAEWVLRDQPEWTKEKIEEAMNGQRPTRVVLKEPLTVVLFYDTVHVDSEGVAHFVGDIYGDDAQLEKAIERGYPYPTKG